MKNEKPQYFTDNGVEMVTMTRKMFNELQEAAEDAEDSAAAIAARAEAKELGTIPAEISRAIRNGQNPVAAWRNYRGWKQTELAERANMLQPAIGRLESGSYAIGRVETLKRIAAALDAPLWSINGSADSSPIGRARRAVGSSVNKNGRITRPRP